MDNFDHEITQDTKYLPEGEQAKNLHTGHRERMRDRYRISGLDGFAPHEILEFILFHTHARCNTNDIAHELLETFGSLAGVLEASYEELVKVKRVGPVAATFISFLPELFRRYSMEKENVKDTFHTVTKLSRYAKSLFVGATVEQFYLMLFDNSMHILDCTLLSLGTVNSVPVVTRRIAERALEKHASYAVVAHNHPDGLPIPSSADLEMTDTLESALRLFEIPLLEHFLVAGNRAVPLMYQHRGEKRFEQPSGPESVTFLRSFYELPDE